MAIVKANISHMDQIDELLDVWENEAGDDSISYRSMETYINGETVYLHIPEDEDIISGIMVVSDSYKYMDLSYLYVHPDYRGDGVGSELLESLTELLDHKCMNAFLKVADNNEAQFLYERFGFIQSKTLKEEGFIDMERCYREELTC